MRPAAKKNLFYRPEIDGLRAVAVLPVVFYHAGFDTVSGGYVGVDVFFVISGYLITQIIRREMDAGSFSILNFYERRARRILPALFSIVVFSAVLSWVIFLPEDLINLAQSSVALAVFSSNVLFWLEAGYFDVVAHLKPLLHTWSLSIEEQFYVFYPLLLLVLVRLPSRYLIIVISLLLGVSLVSAIIAVYPYPSMTFFLLPTRMWELGLGCILALWAHQRPLPENSRASWPDLVGLIGLLSILIPVFFYGHNTRFPGMAAIFPCFGTALLLWSTQYKQGWIYWFLSRPRLVFVGLLSYSLYLWHWVLIVSYEYYLNRPMELAERWGVIVISLAASALSWRIVETPIRKKSILKSRNQIFLVSAVGLVGMITSGLFVISANGYPDRIPQSVLNFGSAPQDLNPRRIYCHADLTPERIANKEVCVLGDQQSKPQYIMWGDSHAEAAMAAFEGQGNEAGIGGYYVGRADCPPLVDVYRINLIGQKRCREFSDVVVEFAIETEIERIILVARWPVYAQGWPDYGTETGPDPFIGTSPTSEATRESSEMAFVRLMKRTVDRLREAGVQVWVMKSIPEHAMSPIRLAWAKHRGLANSKSLSRSLHDERNKFVDDIFGQLRLSFIDTSDILCPNDRECTLIANEKSLYRDEHHLNLTGAKFIEPALRPFFDSMKNEDSADRTPSIVTPQ